MKTLFIGFIAFIICMASTVLNLVLYLSYGGLWNLSCMIFCSGLAVFNLIMISKI